MVYLLPNTLYFSKILTNFLETIPKFQLKILYFSEIVLLFTHNFFKFL